MDCLCCRSNMTIGICEEYFYCRNCAYECVDPSNMISRAEVFLDEDLRSCGIKHLRQSNFEYLHSRILSSTESRNSLLEIGCGHGWYLDIAANDFHVTGIEPDSNVVINPHHKVIYGCFPDALDSNCKYDVIVFNDVFEHLRDSNLALNICKNSLNKNGLLVINLPSSTGFFYRISKFITFFGVMGPFQRMWQKGFPSPHLHYFSPVGMNYLLSSNGYQIIEQGVLKSLESHSLYQRIAYQKSINPIFVSIAYILCRLAIPFLRILPADIFYVIAKTKSYD